MMRVGIDARFWGTNTGIGRYVEELVKAMLKEAAGAEFVLFLRKNNWDMAPEGAERVLADCRWYTLGEQILLPRIFDGAKCDLIHFPHWNVPVGVRTPYVLTIHDLLLLRHPSARATLLGPLRYAVKKMGFNFVLRKAVSNARAIISPSEFSARRVREHFPGSASKIKVVYEGLPALKSGPEFSSLEQRGARKPYLFYVGNAYPHKNLETLIAAAIKLRESGEEINLVLAGRKDAFYERLEDKFGSEKSVIFFGEATDEELDTLYKNAEAYVFPSLEEGFGLPGLEAVARGIPVIASERGALPEIYGNAALYFNPDKVGELAGAIAKIRRESEFRIKMIREGNERVKRFQWEEAARQTFDIYKNALNFKP
ncbi:glycosyltransferase family 4 protein [Candidatus Uhrbacteria bacterium]|nr:glycosyltransferase family 4 protein [Candidatus Uhrbacteria bacterium]